MTSKALGVFLAPNGKFYKQFKILDKKLKRWKRNVQASSLSPRQKIVAYHGYILRGILYVLSATSFSKEQCEQLQKIISPILYNAFRVHRNASRIPLYTPTSLGGYGIVPIYHLQGMEKLKYYIMHRRRADTTGSLLEISTRYTQLEIGTSKPFWSLNYSKYCNYATDTWTSNIWQYLDSCGVKLIDNDSWNYSLPYKNDFYLMDAIIDSDLSVHQKQVFNQLRLYMKVITASDLYDIEYKRLKNNVIGCKYPMTSTLGFPNIKEFPKSWIKLWDSIITSLILPRLKCLPPIQNVSISHLDPATETKTKCSENPITTVNLSHDDIDINSSKFKKAVECIHNNIR